MNTNQTKMTSQDLTIVNNFFTDDEWSAIESALRDYADYGDEEADIADRIQLKISKLYAAVAHNISI